MLPGLDWIGESGFSAKFTTHRGFAAVKGVYSREQPLEGFTAVDCVLEGIMNFWRVYDCQLKNNYVWIDEKVGVSFSQTFF